MFRTWHDWTRGRAGLRAIAALIGLLAVAGCAGFTTAGSDDVGARRLFNAGMKNLVERYVEPVAPEQLSVKGLGNLSAIDPAVSVVAVGNRLQLIAHGRVVGEWPTYDNTNADDWADLIAEALAAARRASPAIAAMNAEDLYEIFFRGALTGLDHYTYYSGREAARRTRATREGFGGIGVTLKIANGSTHVIEVAPESPAARASILPQDRIIQIDGKPVDSLMQADVIDLLRGPVDTSVVLLVQRQTQPSPIEVAIIRRFIVPPTVTVSRDDEVLTVKISGFNQATSRRLGRELLRAEREQVAKPQGIILDLRGNPGGLLDQAVEVSDLFLGQGRIASTVGRHVDSNQTFSADVDERFSGIPMVVLVNGRSASAAEIVAAALNDRGRAVVVGSASFGKGTVQTIVRLPNAGEMAITWARVITPAGRSLHENGIVPALCTSGDAERASALLTALRAGEETANDIMSSHLRRQLGQGSAQQKRAACPPFLEEQAIDVEIAKSLLKNRRLFARALSAIQAAVVQN